jgi:type II secretory pathway component PulM
MKISPRERKFIIVGAAVVAAVMLFYLITLLVPDRESRAQQVDTKEQRLLRYRETLSQKEIYKKRLEQYQQHIEQDMTRLLPGGNPNVAEADLQKLLMSFAEESGVEITRKNTLPEKKIEDDLIKVSVNVEVNCNLDELIRFLTAIEDYDKFLAVEQLNITGFQAQRTQRIRPNMTVVGYINSKAPQPNEARAESREAAGEPPVEVAGQPEE